MSISSASSSTATNISRGIGFTVLSILLFGLQDATAKMLVQDYAVPQIVMMRYWAFGLFSIFLVLRQLGVAGSFHSNRPVLQILRGLILLADILLYAIGLRTLPLGEATAITLMFPIFITLFAIPLLGEKVGRFRWISVILGFVGVLIILRPGFGVFDVGAIFALSATILFSLYAVLTRIVGQSDATATSMLYVAVIGVIGSSAVGVFFWENLTLQAWGLAGLLMVSTPSAHYFVMKALSFAPASVVQPFNYLLLPWSITLSFIVFGQVIDFVSLVGAIIIVTAGLMVWMRERSKTSPSA